MKCIYLRTNTVNGKQYVGQANDFERREYEWNNTSQKYAGAYINNARDKYGLENFKIEILKECNTQEELNYWEQHYIKEFNTKCPNGYNLTDGGEASTGYRFTEEQKKKISESNRGKTAWNKGVPMKEETKEKLHKIHKGKHYSPRTEFKKGCTNIRKGEHHSEESKKKMSEARKGKHYPNLSEAKKGKPNLKLSKKVYQYTIDGKLVREWESTAECSKNGFTHVSACCLGKLKQHKGYVWKYKNDQPN